MKILVTGASGFVGHHLLHELLAAGHEPIALSRSCTWPHDIRHICVATYTPAELALKLKGVRFDVLIHLAGAGSAPADRNILTLSRVNAILPGIMVEAAVACGAYAVVMAGSYAEYRAPQDCVLLTEQAPLEDAEVYGSSKAAGAEFAVAQGHFYTIPVGVARLFNVYGLNDTLSHRLFPSLFSALSQGKEVQLSTGTQVRDFVYIKDACNALRLMAESLAKSTLASGIYNVATGMPHSVADFARKIARALKADDALLQFGALPQRNVPDASFMVGDPRLLEQALGWKYAYSLDAGLEDCVIESGLKA